MLYNSWGNRNSGYIGAGRSVRSQNAIDSYEVPLSMITRDVIDDFLYDCKDDFEDTDYNYLKRLSVSKWKYVASQKVYASSWHHTSSYFNKTYHYDLREIAEKIIEIKVTLDEDYRTYRAEQKEARQKSLHDFDFGVIQVQEWGGSRRRPRIVGYDEVAGIIIGKWLYYKSGHRKNGRIAKYKTNANKVEWLHRFATYEELISRHAEYKSTKRIFNKLIKEKALLD